jgi:hypothetical protein
MRVYNPLRILARSPKWQILYARSKEVAGVKLFSNEYDLTALQLAFLQWLEIYHSLEMDLAMKEKNISREVIDDDIRADAYIYCRSIRDKNKDEKKGPPEGYEPPADVPGVVFRRG